MPKTQTVLAFVSTCIEATAHLMDKPYQEVYQRMKRVGMTEHHIVPYYETLHTESRENIAEGIAQCLKEWEERQ